MGTINIFVGNNLIIDFDIYSLWVNGYSTEECKEHIMKKDPIARETKESIIVRDILDYYCIFGKLEQYLYMPSRLKEQLQFQISNDISDKLIEKYYEYDPGVMREILGHKLTQRQRKDLDDVCEKTNIRVRSCRRQFDNLKRIIRTIEDMKGSLTKNIKENFYLPAKMAEEYAAIVFLARNQFEMSKKKLNYLQLEDFVYCANQMIKNWSSLNMQDNSECDLSKDFLINLKYLRLLTDKDFIDDHKKLVLNGIYKSVNLNKENRSLQNLDSSFKDLSKALLEIAYTLNHSKDMKDLFVDLEEQFIEPCKDNNLTRSDVKLFLEEYRRRAHQLQDIGRDNPNFLAVFERYIVTIGNCIIQMYH